MRTTVTVRDTGWNRIYNELRRIKTAYTMVGFPEHGKISAPVMQGSGHDAIGDMGTMVKIAITHEFGGGKGIPARPYFRPAFDENIETIRKVQQSELNRIYVGQSTVLNSLAVIGEFLTSKIKGKIRSNVPPPLKAATVRRKGSDRTLVDRGQLINSVQHSEVLA